MMAAIVSPVGDSGNSVSQELMPQLVKRPCQTDFRAHFAVHHRPIEKHQDPPSSGTDSLSFLMSPSDKQIQIWFIHCGFEGTVGNSAHSVDTTKCLIFSLGAQIKNPFPRFKEIHPLLSYDHELEI